MYLKRHGSAKNKTARHTKNLWHAWMHWTIRFQMQTLDVMWTAWTAKLQNINFHRMEQTQAKMDMMQHFMVQLWKMEW